jgi:hypothetical protein
MENIRGRIITGEFFQTILCREIGWIFAESFLLRKNRRGIIVAEYSTCSCRAIMAAEYFQEIVMQIASYSVSQQRKKYRGILFAELLHWNTV